MLNRRTFLAATTALSALTPLQWSSTVSAQGRIDGPVILVATPALRDRLYRATVLIAAPLGRGLHIGFILNYPTRSKLSEMFPDHEPSKKVSEPIFLGGPESRGALFALVQRQDGADTGRLALANNLYLEVERDKIDQVIENEHGKARFFAGAVIWRPGELTAEIQRNYWYVQDADTELVLRKSTNGMWEELIKRIERNKNAIITRARPSPDAASGRNT